MSKEAADAIEKVYDLFTNRDVDLYLDYRPSSNPPSVWLGRIIVLADRRGQGLGSQFLTALCEVADQQQLVLTTVPTEQFGGSRPRLRTWFERFGFVANPNGEVYPHLSAALVRTPQGKETDGPAKGTRTRAARPPR